MALTPDQVRSVVLDYVAAWNTNNEGLLLSLYAEDAVFVDPVGSAEFHGHAGIRRFWVRAHAGESRILAPRIDQITICGDEAILRFTMVVREPATNRGLDLAVIDHLVLDEGGRIRTLRAFWDEACITVPPGMEAIVPPTD